MTSEIQTKVVLASFLCPTAVPSSSFPPALFLLPFPFSFPLPPRTPLSGPSWGCRRGAGGQPVPPGPGPEAARAHRPAPAGADVVDGPRRPDRAVRRDAGVEDGGDGPPGHPAGAAGGDPDGVNGGPAARRRRGRLLVR